MAGERTVDGQVVEHTTRALAQKLANRLQTMAVAGISTLADTAPSDELYEPLRAIFEPNQLTQASRYLIDGNRPGVTAKHEWDHTLPIRNAMIAVFIRMADAHQAEQLRKAESMGSIKRRLRPISTSEGILDIADITITSRRPEKFGKAKRDLTDEQKRTHATENSPADRAFVASLLKATDSLEDEHAQAIFDAVQAIQALSANHPLRIMHDRLDQMIQWGFNKGFIAAFSPDQDAEGLEHNIDVSTFIQRGLNTRKDHAKALLYEIYKRYPNITRAQYYQIYERSALGIFSRLAVESLLGVVIVGKVLMHTINEPEFGELPIYNDDVLTAKAGDNPMLSVNDQVVEAAIQEEYRRLIEDFYRRGISPEQYIPIPHDRTGCPAQFKPEDADAPNGDFYADTKGLIQILAPASPTANT